MKNSNADLLLDFKKQKEQLINNVKALYKAISPNKNFISIIQKRMLDKGLQADYYQIRNTLTGIYKNDDRGIIDVFIEIFEERILEMKQKNEKIQNLIQNLNLNQNATN